MRAIRSHDGVAYSVDGRLPSNVTLEALHAVLSELSDVPVGALIVMHPSGRQVDRDSLHTLLHPSSLPDQATVYLFDRELLEIDLEAPEGGNLLAMLELDQEAVHTDVGQDPTKQLETCLDLITCIRHQRASISAALLNLERHRGGRQEAIHAYSHFASPLLTSYRTLLAVYPASIALVSKVKVSHKMQVSKSIETKERLLADYVSKEKMESVRDGCKKTLDELERKNKELETILRTVTQGTEQLKLEGQQENLDDLDECERDAKEAEPRMLHLLQSGKAPQERQELAELEDEALERLRFLNAETRQLLNSLQRIAALQSQIALTPNLITALNNDLRGKCDGFKHLTRLQLLVPSYAATLAEAVRRQLFTKLLKASSGSFAEIFSKFSSDEKKRRGVYQAEWAGKLPWEIPGLEEAILGIEIELRSTVLASNKEDKGKQQDMALEDLEGKSPSRC
ncbi:MAG: oligomeric, coiled-coil, peripheral membrane protein [Cyphobasidiales sp. Tagirdzhanova-0007]|nr:MAG: oligomeric, coiled-coil, peripheral membrane protein [Cyphobasidiales sp. Tagirdzhanova-0007]